MERPVTGKSAAEARRELAGDSRRGPHALSPRIGAVFWYSAATLPEPFP